MATQAKLGYGTLLQRGNGDGPPETFTTIPEVRVVPPISSTRPLKDVTNMDSPSSFREYILGLKDGAEIEAEVNFRNDATQQALMTDHDNGTARNFKLVVPSNVTATFAFAALVTMWQVDPPVDDAIKAKFKLKITGAITRS